MRSGRLVPVLFVAVGALLFAPRTAEPSPKPVPSPEEVALREFGALLLAENFSAASKLVVPGVSRWELGMIDPHRLLEVKNPGRVPLPVEEPGRGCAGAPIYASGLHQPTRSSYRVADSGWPESVAVRVNRDATYIGPFY